MQTQFNAAVVTVSDSSFRGDREDQSGPAVRSILERDGIPVVRAEVVPDERKRIAELLRTLCDDNRVDLIVTTGGTGFAPRDVTPEATLDVIEKRAEGLELLMRLESLKITPAAALSRAVCGMRGASLIINLPGSPKGARENLEAVMKVLDHGLILLKGGTLH
jgi:molybdopterin adenylyltransferase